MRKYNVFVLFWILALVALLTFLFFTLGNGVIRTDRTSFEGVSDNGEVFVRFRGAYLNRFIGQPVKIDIALYPEIDKAGWIEIKIDEKLEATLISFYPKDTEVFFRPFIFAKAQRVVVWVSSEQEKKSWEIWARKVENDHWENIRIKNKKPEAKKITPTI